MCWDLGPDVCICSLFESLNTSFRKVSALAYFLQIKNQRVMVVGAVQVYPLEEVIEINAKPYINDFTSYSFQNDALLLFLGESSSHKGKTGLNSGLRWRETRREEKFVLLVLQWWRSLTELGDVESSSQVRMCVYDWRRLNFTWF